MIYELMGRAHAALAGRLAIARGRGRWRGREHGQGTVEYVGLVLLMAVLIAGVVKASNNFSDTGIAEAVVKKLKAAIAGVGEGGG
jgi:chromate transport protein ChrA